MALDQFRRGGTQIQSRITDGLVLLYNTHAADSQAQTIVARRRGTEAGRQRTVDAGGRFGYLGRKSEQLSVDADG